MNAKDQAKLLKRGFSILRIGKVIINHAKSEFVIKYKSPDHPEWTILEKGFTSESAVKKAVEKLTRLEDVVEE